MREIANDPQGFMLRQGWGVIALDDSEELDKLMHLYEALEGKVIELLEALDDLHQSAEYELHQLVLTQPDLLSRVAEVQSHDLAEENKVLEDELEKISSEIRELQS